MVMVVMVVVVWWNGLVPLHADNSETENTAGNSAAANRVSRGRRHGHVKVEVLFAVIPRNIAYDHGGRVRRGRGVVGVARVGVDGQPGASRRRLP